MSVKQLIKLAALSLLFVQVAPSLASEIVMTKSSDVKEKQTIVDQKIKLKTLNTVKDVRQLIEDVAYPEKNRIKVYLSHAQAKYFMLKKVTVVLDGVDKTEQTYNETEQLALIRGGSNRVYTASVAEGYHELVLVFEGKDRDSNIIKKAETWLFDKKAGEMIIVIKVDDNEATIRPEFRFKVIKG